MEISVGICRSDLPVMFAFKLLIDPIGIYRSDLSIKFGYAWRLFFFDA